MTAGQIGWGAFVAGAVWFLTHFVGKPILAFFDLRREVIRGLNQYANVRARYRELPDGRIEDGDELSETEKKRLDEAKSAFRDLASRMGALAYNDRFAVIVLRLVGYDPLRVSKGLFGISNSIDSYGATRHRKKKKLAAALKLKDF